MTHTEAKWVERVRAWRLSGQTAVNFAAGKDFEPSTLRYWVSRLNRMGLREPTVAMVHVRRSPANGVEPLAVVVGSARIEVRTGFNHALLCEVVDALGAPR